MKKFIQLFMYSFFPPPLKLAPIRVHIMTRAERERRADAYRYLH